MLQGEHSAILSTFFKLPFVINIFVLSIFKWPFYTVFTVCVKLFFDVHHAQYLFWYESFINCHGLNLPAVKLLGRMYRPVLAVGNHLCNKQSFLKPISR